MSSPPETIIFIGVNDTGDEVQVVAHYSTCHVKLFLVERDEEKDMPEAEFGFVTPENKE